MYNIAQYFTASEKDILDIWIFICINIYLKIICMLLFNNARTDMIKYRYVLLSNINIFYLIYSYFTIKNFGICTIFLCFWKKYLILTQAAFDQKYIKTFLQLWNIYTI